MNTEQIQNALHERDLSFGLLAEALGVSTAHISQVVARKTASHRVADAVAKALAMPVTEVFPDKPEYHHPYHPKAERSSRLRKLRKTLEAA